MRTSMPSARKALILASLAAASTALAQDAVRQNGESALDHVKEALSAAQDRVPDSAGPILPPPPPDTVKRRAFQGLGGRVRSEAMDKRARQAVVAGEAALALGREAQAKRLRQALGLEPGDGEDLAKTHEPAKVDAWVPVLFVSSSMPIAVLRRYAEQLELVHGVLAFRGMPGGLHRVGPMAKLSAQILRLNPGCAGPSCAMRNVQLIVDPIVFRQHGVTRVPALAMVPGDPTKAYCERDDESARAAHLVLGDSALSGMLDEYARLGGVAEVKNAQALLARR